MNNGNGSSEPLNFLSQISGTLVDTNVEGVVIKGKGHWLMEEAPQKVIPGLVAFINKSR